MTGFVQDIESLVYRHVDADVDIAIEDVRRLAGGASRPIYGFRLRTGDEAADYVLRVESRTPVAATRVHEAELLSHVYQAGVLVPAIRWSGESAGQLGGAYVVMDRVVGEALPRKLFREARYENTRRNLPGQLARELARIHQVDPGTVADAVGWSLGAVDETNATRFATLAQLEQYETLRRALAEGRPQPVFELVHRWLVDRLPPPTDLVLVHGDFRLGNMMFDENGLAAILDWELAHLGDAYEDLGWLAVRSWRFGRNELPIGGLTDRETFWQAYEEASGRIVDPESARYWELYGNWRWGVICMMQTGRRRDAGAIDVELASIGRRVSEVEREMLRLLEALDEPAASAKKSAS